VIRDYTAADEEPIVELSLRAWEPVFRSVEETIGPELNALLHGDDWRRFQETEVRDALGRVGARVWVAERDRIVVGFVVAATGDARRRIGEVTMLAVDPGSQLEGLGTELTETATAWLRASGMLVAFIGTGGDPGHAPARRVYEKLAYTPFPVVQYYRAL
jgi:GNAT superfamily N-acetyltransferase